MDGWSDTEKTEGHLKGFGICPLFCRYQVIKITNKRKNIVIKKAINGVLSFTVSSSFLFFLFVFVFVFLHFSRFRLPLSVGVPKAYSRLNIHNSAIKKHVS